MKLLLIIATLWLQGSVIFADPIVICNDPDTVSIPYLVYRERELKEIHRQLSLICQQHNNSHLIKARDEVWIALRQINQLNKNEN